MIKVQYYAASSLDGYLATQDHSLDWLLQFGSEEQTSYPEFIRDVGALCMGANTYEWMLRHVVGSKALSPERWPYTQPAWVFTRRALPAVPEADIRFVSGDVQAVYRDMVAVAGGKNIWIVGGGDLAGQFYDAGLLDELIVQIAPVTLGAGRPFFPQKRSDTAAEADFGRYLRRCFRRNSLRSFRAVSWYLRYSAGKNLAGETT